MSKAPERELPLRIIVLHPPPNVRFSVQQGRHGLLPPAHTSDDALTFELAVRAAARDGGVNILGPFAQGPPADRFIYVNSGTSTGQAGTPWTRRAKLKMRGITAALVDEALATPGAVLEARIHGRARDGGPCCATVPLLNDGWRVAL